MIWRLYICLASALPGFSASTTNLNYAQVPAGNPLKGLCNFLASSDPSTWPTNSRSLWRVNLPLRDLMSSPTNFTWDLADICFDRGATNDGCQVIPRIFLDYPGSGDTSSNFWLTGAGYDLTHSWYSHGTNAIPQFLLDDGLQTWTYSDPGNTVSLIPDYADTNLISAVTNFIAAFGARYDGDPRIAFIEMGILGMWGEWHCDGKWQWTNSLTIQEAAYLTYLAAFPNTKLLVRYPSGADNTALDEATAFYNGNLELGYHDDSMGWHTLGTNGFYLSQQLSHAAATNKWKTQVFGGEQRTELATHYWEDPPYFYATTNGSIIITNQALNLCISNLHTTYMQSVWWTSQTGGNMSRAIESSRLMGYELYAKSFSQWLSNSVIYAGITITNTGVAPFYYDWTVQLAAATNGAIAQTWDTPWALSSIIPGDGDVNLECQLTNPPTRPFTLLLRAVNPMSNGKVLRFANETQHQTITNWLTLGLLSDELLNYGTGFNVSRLNTETLVIGP